jgi:hypothetical protein
MLILFMFSIACFSCGIFPLDLCISSLVSGWWFEVRGSRIKAKVDTSKLKIWGVVGGK